MSVVFPFFGSSEHVKKPLRSARASPSRCQTSMISLCLLIFLFWCFCVLESVLTRCMDFDGVTGYLFCLWHWAAGIFVFQYFWYGTFIAHLVSFDFELNPLTFQVAQVCTNCGVNMGEYFCDICKFYDDDVNMLSQIVRTIE